VGQAGLPAPQSSQNRHAGPGEKSDLFAAGRFLHPFHHLDFFSTTMQMPSQVFRSIPLGAEFFIATIPRLFESS